MEHVTVNADVSIDELADRISYQYIIQGDSDREFAYLAALALETKLNDEYDIERTLSEFIRNTSALDLSLEECEEIEEILRQ